MNIRLAQRDEEHAAPHARAVFSKEPPFEFYLGAIVIAVAIATVLLASCPALRRQVFALFWP